MNSYITKMSSTKVFLMAFAGVLILQNSTCHRLARSPDKMEVDFPDYSSDREEQGQDFDDRRQDEEEYWQGEGQRGEGQFEKMEEDREQNRGDREQKLEDEAQYREEERESYNKEAEESYSKDRQNLEEHNRNDEEHYKYENNRGTDNPQQFDDEINDKGERYGGKGSEYAQEREGDIEDYEMEGKGPSISYQQG